MLDDKERLFQQAVEELVHRRGRAMSPCGKEIPQSDADDCIAQAQQIIALLQGS